MILTEYRWSRKDYCSFIVDDGTAGEENCLFHFDDANYAEPLGWFTFMLVCYDD